MPSQKFSAYFNDWLYGPKGYYSNAQRVGASGDFITSVTTSGFFAATIANHFLRLVRDGFFNPDYVWFIELGANRGLAMQDVIRYIADRDLTLLKRLKFCAVESNDASVEVLRERLREFELHTAQIAVIKNIADINAKEAFVFANEVLDCAPCELIYEQNLAMVEGGVIKWDGKDAKTLKYANDFGIIKGEIPIAPEEFASQFQNIKKCEALFFDYGQNFARNDFSIRIYHNHQTSPLFELDNLATYFGVSDLTYDVNFEFWTKAFASADFGVVPIITQARALVDFGINELIERMFSVVDEKVALSKLGAIKKLLAPDFFGERFKLLRAIRG